MPRYTDLDSGEENLTYDQALEIAQENCQEENDLLDAFNEIANSDFLYIWRHLDEEAKMTIYDRAVAMYFHERFYEEESEEEEEQREKAL